MKRFRPSKMPKPDSGVEDRLKTLSAGFQMHVPKPVEPAELVAIVASLTGRTALKTPPSNTA